MAEEVVPTNEIGSAVGDSSQNAWSQFGGGDGIERVTELQWPQSVVTYGSMLNDAQVQSLWHGLMLPIRAYRYYINPNGAPPSSVERVSMDYNLPVGEDGEFNRLRAQRRFSFDKHLEDALRALQYGHYFFEQVGEIDGDLIWHLRKLGIRPPRTLTEINVADDGGLKNIVQGYRHPNPIVIPVNRLVAYVWDREGANWTGRSILRSIYRNYLVKDRVLRVGAINIERAGGVPYVQAPEGASGDQIRELDALARRFRVGEGAGAALPHGAQLKFAMAAGGDGAVAYLKQQNEEMARAFLQMVSMLGQTNSGSRALGGTFHEILQVAQFTIAKWFCDTFNEHVIEDDVEWNEGPETEYAPLIEFDAGEQDPMAGLQEEDKKLKENPDGEGLQVEDPKTRAAMGLDEPQSRRRRTARRGGSPQQPKTGGVRAANDLASRVSLPPRPLRRQPNEWEIQAAIDYSLIDSTYDAALTNLQNEVRMARSFQIDELHDAIVGSVGDLRRIQSISTEISAVDRISAHLQAVATYAVDQALQEANRQGVDIPRQPTDDIASFLTARAESIDRFLREDVTQSAIREAMRLTGGGLTPAEVADQTRAFLESQTGVTMKDMLGGAIQQSINSGRKLVFQRDGRDGTIRSSEILDTNTCSHCIGIDGTEYESVEAAERDYPTGGYRNCDGRERCRGMLIKVYAPVREPSTVEEMTP